MDGSKSLRTWVSLYGCALGLIAAWLLLTEACRSQIVSLPASPQAATPAASQRNDAVWAARIGLLRGELWAELTYTYAGLDYWITPASTMPPLELSQALASALKTLDLLPANSGAWLMLADLSSRMSQPVASPIEALKMSYYTGANEDALVPLRMLASARLDSGTDSELDRLFQDQIEMVLSARPALRAALASAYAAATPQAQRLIDDTVARTDASFMTSLHSKPAR
jgi:hypothetical protein